MGVRRSGAGVKPTTDAGRVRTLDVSITLDS
jgi:hypothetical protein